MVLSKLWTLLEKLPIYTPPEYECEYEKVSRLKIKPLLLDYDYNLEYDLGYEFVLEKVI